MNHIRFLTAGESHGRGLVGILEGIPSGLSLSHEDIDKELKRRQTGYGRSSRMKIEQDHAEIISGVRWGQTIGSPISLLIENKDWKNWQEGISPDIKYKDSIPPVTRPRPGHADLSGALKYGHTDIRNTLERSSARETAMRVAIGSIAKKFLSEFRINISSFVLQIGSIKTTYDLGQEMELKDFFEKVEISPVRCPDEEVSYKMIKLIDRAAQNGDTLGGIFEVVATGIPLGLGTHIQWDRRLDSRLSHALMSIQAIKGIEVGTGFKMAERFGSEVMDEIYYRAQNTESRTQNTERRAQTKEAKTLTAGGFYRKTNHAGGIEGGISSAMPIVIRAAMKPIPTLKKPLSSVDIITKKPLEATYERSDVCAVPAASVVAEAMVALVIADTFLEKFGGDRIEETKGNFESYMEYLERS